MADVTETELTFMLSESLKKEVSTLRQATDWPDFKKRVGRIEGLEKALEIEINLAKKLHEYDDDDEDDDLL